jgi:hypothetical protein
MMRKAINRRALMVSVGASGAAGMPSIVVVVPDAIWPS